MSTAPLTLEQQAQQHAQLREKELRDAAAKAEAEAKAPAPVPVPPTPVAPPPAEVRHDIPGQPSAPIVRGFTVVTVAPNEFEIHVDGKSMKGKHLSPTETAVVMGWLQSLPKEHE